jgi:hypothetical protein
MVTLAMLAGLAMPPPEYDYTPNPRPEVVEFGPDLISQACGVPFRVAGCFIRGKVFLLSTLTPDARALVLRHEYGHANGWRH